MPSSENITSPVYPFYYQINSLDKYNLSAIIDSPKETISGLASSFMDLIKK